LQRNFILTEIHWSLRKPILLLWIFAACITRAQSPAFRWATELPFEITCQCTDRKDNVYIAGTFSCPIQFGNTTLTPQSYDVIVAKYDSSGVFQWYRHYGGQGVDQSIDIQCDHKNEIVITNLFNLKTIYYGDTIQAPNHGVAMVKLSEHGDLRWYKIPAYKDTSCIHGFFSAVDRDDNIYLSGNISYGNAYFSDTVIHCPGSLIGYVAKFRPDGSLLWVRAEDGAFGRIHTDHSGNVLILSDSIYKYSSTHQLLWSKKHNFVFSDFPYHQQIATDSADNFYVFTDFKPKTIVGNDTIGLDDSCRNILIKFSPAGVPVLKKSAYFYYNPKLNSSSLYGNAIYITGAFTGKAYFGHDSVVSICEDYHTNSFLVAYDLDGSQKFVKPILCKKALDAKIVTAGKSVYLSGSFRDTAMFDQITLAHPAPGAERYFLARLENEVNPPFTYPPSLNIYPNPAKGFITIAFNDSFEDASLEIYNLQGKRIFSRTPAPNPMVVELSELANGLYIIQLKNKNNTLVRKFIKI